MSKFKPNESIAEIIKAVSKIFLIYKVGVPEFAANPIGDLAAGIIKGIEIKPNNEMIKDRLDHAINTAWDVVLPDFDIPKECEKTLKEELMTAENAISFVQLEHPENTLRTKASDILKRHVDWDVRRIDGFAKDISDGLMIEIYQELDSNGILKNLVEIYAIKEKLQEIYSSQERSADDIQRNRELLEKLVEEVSVNILKVEQKNEKEYVVHQLKPASVDFSSYYERIKKRFTANKKDEYAALVGDEPDERAYIEAYITIKHRKVSVLEYLEKWFDDTKSGAILIYGEPGHGKSLLCDKAVFDFCSGKFLEKKAKNVLAVSLNISEKPSIITNNEVKLSNTLAWGAENEYKFSFKDCGESLLFLDGFDEFIDAAKQANINNICSFMKKVKTVAEENNIHIVVLSRKISVSKYIEDLSGICPHFELLPVSDEQQDEWLKKHPDYNDYKNAFVHLRENRDMKELLGVPLLFRLIVYNRFETVSSNVVDLYETLFSRLMRKRNVYGDSRQVIENGLMDHAFKVYCTDSNMALLEAGEWNSQWVFAFYVKTNDGKKAGFFHRTFYQFFLAKYICREIMGATDENAENLIGAFAERELDNTVRDYLGKIDIKGKESEVHAGIEKMINALVNTEAYLNFEPRVKSGNAEKSKILRSENIYRNTLHIAAAFSYVIQIPFKENLDVMMRTFNSTGIELISKDDKKADLRGADLRGARLSGIKMIGADLTGANLSGAILTEAILHNANLERAQLEGTFLRNAELTDASVTRANLTKADLSYADLTGTDPTAATLTYITVIGTNMFGQSYDFTSACLHEAVIDIKYKDKMKSCLKGYDSIKWVTEEGCVK